MIDHAETPKSFHPIRVSLVVVVFFILFFLMLTFGVFLAYAPPSYSENFSPHGTDSVARLTPRDEPVSTARGAAEKSFSGSCPAWGHLCIVVSTGNPAEAMQKIGGLIQVEGNRQYRIQLEIIPVEN